MKVSVVIPTHNRAVAVARAVQSVLWQTYPSWEVIVVDDGSTDATAAALEPYAGRIHYLRQSQLGPSAARNAGAAIATGEWLAFLDSDDLWMPWHLANQVALIRQAGLKLSCCVANTWITSHAEGLTTTSFADAGLRLPHPRALLLNPLETLAGRFVLFNQTTTMLRARFLEIGGYDASLWLLEDYHLALRLARFAPWGLVRTPSVVKPNESVGLGVQCMMQPQRHRKAQEVILTSILADPALPDGTAKWLLRLARRATIGHGARRAITIAFWRGIHRSLRQATPPHIVPVHQHQADPP